MAKRPKMRDGLIQRGKDRWTVCLYLGLGDPDPVTGKRRPKQFTKSLGKCTRKEAERQRDELRVALRKNQFVAPSRLTTGEWLLRWLDESVRPVQRVRTISIYETAIRKHLIPALGGIPLQSLRAGQIAKYYRDKAADGLSSATLQGHAAVLSAALRSAVRQDLIERNAASLVDGKPRAARDREDAKLNCWDRDEARAFLWAVTTEGPQLTAFFNLALDTGARCGDLQALQWADVDLDAGTVLIDSTLLSRCGPPVYGPTK